MNNRQSRVLASFDSLLRSDRIKRAPAESEIAPIADSLRSTLREITSTELDQMSNRRAHWLGVIRKRLDRVRTEEMLPLSRLCRRVLAGERAMIDALAVPHKRAPNEDIIGAAERMISVLEPHRQFLEQSRIDTTRLDRLASEIQEIRNALPAASASVADRAVPTRRIAELFRSARRDADALAMIIGATLREKAERKFWKGETRVQKKPGRPSARKRRRTIPKSQADTH